MTYDEYARLPRGLVVATSPCQRTTGINNGGWVTYARMQKKLLDKGLKVKLWVLVGRYIETCCDSHDPNSFDDGRRFRIRDEVGLRALVAQYLLHRSVKRAASQV